MVIRIAKKRVYVDAELKIERGVIFCYDGSYGSKQVIHKKSNIQGFGRLEQPLPRQKISRRTLHSIVAPIAAVGKKRGRSKQILDNVE